MPSVEEPAAGIGAMLVSSRTLAEYRRMFALTDEELRLRLLDCPGGTASFAAEVSALGGDATACDPVYTGHDAEGLTARALAETDRANHYVRTHPDEYSWTFFADADEHLRLRGAAGLAFGADMRANPDRYVPAELPALPFADGAFDLVLSSHLLFSYVDRLDFSFHLRAIAELVRVAGREARVFPLVAMGSPTVYGRMDELRAELAGHRVGTEIVDVDYELQTGGTQMLRCHRIP